MGTFPFFIVGHERSGTTLMAAAFDRHSRIAVPPETHFFTDLCPASCARMTAEPKMMIDHFARGARIRDLQLQPAELLSRLDQPRATWADLFVSVLKTYAQSRGKPWFGEKTPNHWKHVPHLMHVFPNCCVIWLVRDGRDTVLSNMKMPWRRHSNLTAHAMGWADAAESMLALQALYPDRILRVRFEDLVTSPGEEIHRACDFVGVDFEERQLDPTVATGVVPEWEMSWKDRIFAAPDPSRIGTGVREFNKESITLMNAIMEPSLHRLGYLAQEIPSCVAV